MDSTRLLGRSKELGRLRSILDRREPHLVLVSGIRGGGKSSLLRHAMSDYAGFVHVCPPLPDPVQRAVLARRIRGLPAGTGSELEPADPPDEAGWGEILRAALHRLTPGAAPFVLVLDDAHRLSQARSRHLGPVREALRSARAEDLALHVVLVGPESALSELPSPRRSGGPSLGDEAVSVEALSVGPLPLRAAAPLLPGNRPHYKIRAYGMFGGIPRVLAHLDPSVTAGTNVRRLALDPDGPLADAAADWLERDLQAPPRYYAIMAALAPGEADWSRVHAGVPDLTRSGQVAPYLKRLAELGLVESRRSLDAGPSSRSTRYQLSDPFLAFWFRFVLPYRLGPLAREQGDREGDHYAREIRPLVDEHLRSVFPRICRQHMTYDAIETLGAVAREGGSLWGQGYDLPVAGILTSGAAYYGECVWRHGEDEPSPLEALEAGIHETRYGFGREGRLRLVFTGRPPPASLRRAVVRHRDAQLIDAEALLG